jgi:group I intron endonuclease
MTGIYKFTNPENKVYIGASKDVFKRISHYKKHKRKLDTLWYNSLNKYGYNNHIFEVIEECSVDDLNERERYWQDFYNVLEGGLNMVLTGTKDKKEVRSKEMRSKISISNKGKVMSEEARKKISIAHKGKVVSEETRLRLKSIQRKKGWNHSQEAKDKMSQKTKGIARPNWSRGNSFSAKKVIDINTGEIFSCIIDAANYIGISSSCLSNRLKGRTPNETSLRYFVA